MLQKNGNCNDQRKKMTRVPGAELHRLKEGVMQALKSQKYDARIRVEY